MTQISNAKITPNSKESEMLVLGCMLTNTESLVHAVEELDDSDFYYSEHKTILQAIKSVYGLGEMVDIHLVYEKLKSQDKLKPIGGAGYLTLLAQYAGTSANIKEYVSILKNKTLLRDLINKGQSLEQFALENPDNPMTLIEELQHSLKGIEQRYGRKLSLLSIDARIKQLDEVRNSYNGKKYLGLCVRTIEEINDKLLGLRKLTLLAAAPNVGKTALTIQLALEVLLTEPEACLAYFSLEMTSLDIFTRMNMYLSQMNFRSLIFGRHERSDHKGESTFSADDFKKITTSKETLKHIGERLQIIDTTTCPFIDARTVINFVENLKATTKCKRAIVIIDYLQVWPMESNLRLPSENEADKWRMGEMKKIRDAMNEDPVIVISEARKPSGTNDVWGGDLSDVMGSARGTYTPDVVMLLSQLRPKALAKVWDKNNMPKDLPSDDSECAEDEKAGFAIKNFLASQGIALCKLDVPKARDGMHKFSILLEFHFHKNIFKKVVWKELKEVVKKNVPEKNFLFS